MFNLVKILYYTGGHSWFRSGLHCIGKACCFLFCGVISDAKMSV